MPVSSPNVAPALPFAVKVVVAVIAVVVVLLNIFVVVLSIICGPPLADIEPLKYNVSHL